MSSTGQQSGKDRSFLSQGRSFTASKSSNITVRPPQKSVPRFQDLQGRSTTHTAAAVQDGASSSSSRGTEPQQGRRDGRAVPLISSSWAHPQGKDKGVCPFSRSLFSPGSDGLPILAALAELPQTAEGAPTQPGLPGPFPSTTTTDTLTPEGNLLATTSTAPYSFIQQAVH